MKSVKYILFLLAIVIFASIMASGLSVPQLISYQGRLNNAAGQPLDGETVDITFSFYGTVSGGTIYLSVLQDDVLVTGGIYNVLIGSGTISPGTDSTLSDVFRKHKDVWMGIKVNTDPEMAPRARITSVGFAMKADKVDTGWLDTYLAASDYDGDSHTKISQGGDDCNDGNPSIYSNAPELCDGIDNQCSGDPGYGSIDEGCNCIDNDGDGYGTGCIPGTDCDDGKSAIYTGSPVLPLWMEASFILAPYLILAQSGAGEITITASLGTGPMTTPTSR